MIATALQTLAKEAFAQNRLARASALWAASENTQPEKPQSSQSSQVIGADWLDLNMVEDRLGRSAFSEAWNRGSKLSLDDAIEFALSDMD
jgi:hypothetical protein